MVLIWTLVLERGDLENLTSKKKTSALRIKGVKRKLLMESGHGERTLDRTITLLGLALSSSLFNLCLLEAKRVAYCIINTVVCLKRL